MVEYNAGEFTRSQREELRGQIAEWLYEATGASVHTETESGEAVTVIRLMGVSR